MTERENSTPDEEPVAEPARESAEPAPEVTEPEVMAATTDVAVDEPFSDDKPVAEGDVIRTLEWYFPLIWLAMLIIVSYIGIYYAVEHLPGSNPLPPSFEF